MSEMIERVALALTRMCPGFKDANMPVEICRFYAQAAIEAMREPTEAMAEAASHVAQSVPGFAYGIGHFDFDDLITAMHRAMIDAATKP